MSRCWHTVTLQFERSVETVTGGPQSRVEGWLVEQGISGWEELDEGLRFYLSPEDVERGRLQALRQAFNHDGPQGARPGVDWSDGDIHEEDWAEGWKQYFKPTLVSKRLAVCPTWEDWEPPEGVRAIRMDPGMAFGTGAHSTTRLCLELMERYLPAGGRVLDVGAGTGVLAMGALMLGAAHAVLTDSDPLCTAVCRENLERNGLHGEVHLGSSFEPVQGRSFDLVIANLMTPVLLDMAPGLAGYLDLQGVFIGSGTTTDKVPLVMAALQQHGLAVLECRTEGDWAAVAAQKLATSESLKS